MGESKCKAQNLSTFIDERGILFYSTVFSSSERDAAYVIAINRVAQACKDRGWA